MKITKSCDYALKTLLYMAKDNENTLFKRSDLSQILEVPDSFLGKILHDLARVDILASERGKNGGFRFDKDLDDISLYDVVIGIEGKIAITDCIADSDYCSSVESCPIHTIWYEIQDDLTAKLKSITLGSLTKQPDCE